MPKKVVGELAFRRRHHHAARVGKLLGVLVPGVVESRRLGQRVDRRLLSGQEVPALCRARALVAVEIGLLHAGRQHRRFLWIEADGHDVEFLADRFVNHA